MYSENTTFTLVHWWLKHREGWTNEEKQAAFNKILESDVLRFHRMGTNYLILYAMRSPWIKGSGQAFDILHQTLLKIEETKVREESSKLPSNRATKETDSDGAKWFELEGIISREMCMSLQDNIISYCLMSIVKGFPVMLGVKKSVGSEGKATLMLYGGWSAGSLSDMRKQGHEVLKTPLTMRIKISVGNASYVSRRTSYIENEAFGKPNMFQTPWEEIVKDDSHWFTPQGEMKVKLEVSIKSG